MRAAEVIVESVSFGVDDFKHQGFRDKAIELSAITKQYIQEHCGPWLSQAGSGVAYRGISERAKQGRVLFTHPVRTDRRPKDSTASTHEFFNDLISLTGGVANRSNSAFVTPSISTAENYGQACVVMPVGEFSYTWSPDIKDWYSQEIGVRGWWDPQLVMQHVSQDLIHRTLARVQMPAQAGQELETLTRLRNQHVSRSADFAIFANLGSHCYSAQSVAEHIWADKGLETALDRGNEIMIHCGEMLYLDAVYHGAMINYHVSPF